MEVRMRQVRLNLIQFIEYGLENSGLRGFAGRAYFTCVRVNPAQILYVRYRINYRDRVFRKECFKLVSQLVKLSCLNFIYTARISYIGNVTPCFYLMEAAVRLNVVFQDGVNRLFAECSYAVLDMLCVCYPVTCVKKAL